MITSHTALYGVFGDPISHSLSPLIHNAAFAHIGYDAAYLAFRIRDIRAAISAMKTLSMKGASVTIPHKISVMEYLDEIDDMARDIGAVNTVINRDGRLSGYNSDWLGAMRALKEKTEICGKSVGIIGAGGAARAIGFGVRKEGGKAIIINRSASKGESLAKDIGAEFIPLSEISTSDCRIIINTTPLGMTPNTDTTPIPKDMLHNDMTIMDIVYNPLKTRLLKESEEQGCTIIDGLSMFIYQGVFQSELWTGKPAPIELMRDVAKQYL